MLPHDSGKVKEVEKMYHDSGKVKEAEKMWEQMLAQYEKELEPDHPQILAAVQKLGELYHGCGKSVEAEKMWKRALAGYEKTLGPDHLDTLAVAQNLGVLYHSRGRFEEAEEMWKRALVGYKKALEPEHPDVLRVVHNLAMLYYNRGKSKEAERMWKQVLAGYEKTLEPNHPRTLMVVQNLGMLYHDRGRFEEAEKMWKQALAGYEKALGLDHPQTLMVVQNLSILYNGRGEVEEAEKMLKRALVGYEKTVEPDHPDVLRLVCNLGVIYRGCGKVKEAEEMWKRALAGYEKALGPDHPDTLGVALSLHMLYEASEKVEEAESMLKRTLAGYEKALEPDHASKLAVVQNLGKGESSKQPSSRKWFSRGSPLLQKLGNLNLRDAKLPRYTFEPLDGHDHIRVLELHPTTGSRLECSIRQISLFEGDYQALSYVWGSEERLFRAIVRNEKGEALGYIPLTTNLSKALRDLRDAKELKNKVFWIDQICIDQDGKEKNHQVALMGQIYMSAERVITYIGHGGPDGLESKGAELLKQIYHHFWRNYSMMIAAKTMPEARSERSAFAVKELAADIESRIGTREWDWLVEVTHGEWTSRLWILQEQRLNANMVMLRGSRLLQWEVVAVIPILFSLNLLPYEHVNRFWRENPDRTGFAYDPRHIAEFLYSVWWDRITNSTTSGIKKNFFNPTTTLFGNMARYYTLNCRDPRDRIYALLTISSDTAKLAIKPDYSPNTSPSDLFRQLTTSILHETRDPDVLSLACFWDNSSDPAHPSWAFNIPRPCDLEAVTLPLEVCTAHPRKKLSSSPRLQPGGFALILRGQILDRISLSTPPLYWSRSHRLGASAAETARTESKELQNMSQILFSLGATAENAAALCRAITANPTWSPPGRDGASVTMNTAFHLWCYFRFLMLDHREFLANSGNKRDLLKVITLIETMAAFLLKADNVESFSPSDFLNEEELAAYVTVCGSALVKGRSFCVTEQRRVGSCMHEVKEGDAVAALEGAGVLFILRPVGDRYRLISDAYVDGLMLGEAYQGVDPDKVDYDIVLI